MVRETSHEHAAQTELSEGDWKCTVPLVVTALGCVALFVWATELRELLLPILEVTP